MDESDTILDAKAGRSYYKGELLGKGGFAKCFLFRHVATGHVCAGKCVEKGTLKKERARKKLLSEIKIHRSLSHKNIVRFEHFFEDKTRVYILLEYCNSQTLMELVKRNKRLSDMETQSLSLQILNGVEYLHSVNVIHRDLKLGNIFLTNGNEVRIGDFGLATKLEHSNEMKKTMCGTPNYIAPEILDGKLGHSFEVDIWSIGVIIYTMLVGRPPFETKDVKQTYKRIQANLYSFPSKLEVSRNSKSLIRSILTKDPKDRPNLTVIKQHDFYQQGVEEEQSSSLSELTDKENANTENFNAEPLKEKIFEKPAVFVEKWVDYTSKYGLGYILESGIVGVYFNDSTKLVVDRDREHFQYYERASNTFQSHTLDEYPDELKKKVTLVKHFRTYLEKDCDISKPPPAFQQDIVLPYVKKWIRTRHAIFFRLSNRTVQVAFFDDTQLLLSAQARMLTFFDKQKNATTIAISEAKAQPDIFKRLKYTKEVLHQLITPGASSPK